jgi:hypothetical protein
MPRFFSEETNRDITVRYYNNDNLAIPEQHGLFIKTSFIDGASETDIFVTYASRPHAHYGVLDKRIDAFNTFLESHLKLDSQTNHCALPYVKAYALCSFVQAYDDPTPHFLDALNALLPPSKSTVQSEKNDVIAAHPHKKRKIKKATFNLPDDTTSEAQPLGHQDPDVLTTKTLVL